jgi:hypothetical protein
MKKVIITSLLVAASFLPKAALANFPAGANNIASAPDASLSQLTSNVTDVSGFNYEVGETTHHFNYPGNAGNRSAWWKWTPTESGFCTIDTVHSGLYGGANALRDTTVAIYRLTNPASAVSVTNLTPLASNNNYGNYFYSNDYTFSKATFYAAAGTTYYIAADGGWSGAVTSTSKLVSIRLRQVPAVAHTRRGLWHLEGHILGNRGSMVITLTSTGSYSAVLMVGTARYTLAGQLDTDGTTVRSIPRPVAAGATPLTPITVMIDASQESYFEVQMDGDVTREQLYRQSVFTKTSPSVLAATYNIANPDSGGSGVSGRGYLRSTISPTGAVTMVGVAYDGTKVTGSSAICQQIGRPNESYAPAFVPAYGNKGCIVYDNYIETASSAALHRFSCYMDILRPAPTSPTTVFYPTGIQGEDSMEGLPYVRPAVGARILNLLTGTGGLGILTLHDSSGELASPIQEGFNLSTANKCTFISPLRKPSLTINTTTGIVTGSITTTDTILGVTKPRVRKLVGLVISDQSTPGLSYLVGHATGVTKNLMFEVVPDSVAP